MQQPVASVSSTQPMVTSSTKVDAFTKMLALEAKALESGAKKSTIPAPQEVRLLEVWPNEVRGVPNAFLRSSLFSISRNRKEFNDLQKINSSSDIELSFKGTGFNQTDLDVWIALLHLARRHPLNSEVRFTAYSMLKALGRNTGKTEREQLKKEISRLASGLIEIRHKKEDFGGALVTFYKRDQVTQEYVVILNKELFVLYEWSLGYSHINWKQRQALKSNLAKWLHGFSASHVNVKKTDKKTNKKTSVYVYKVKTIHEHCGSTAKELWKFRQMLKKALDELLEVGAIKGWEIDSNDNLDIDAIPSNSQRKHMKRKNHYAARGSNA